jgi:hypothetical protein
LITTCIVVDNIEVENEEQGVKLENRIFWQPTAYSEKLSAFSNNTYNSTKLSNLLVGDIRSPERRC